MERRDQGILLSSRTHGETSAIIEVFTPDHGRHAGVVRGGTSRKMAPVLQPGAQLDLAWRARLEDHLGTFQPELLRSRAAASMSDRLSLAGLNAVTALLLFALPEREAHPKLYSRTEALLDLLGQSDVWPLAYLQWELALLDELGLTHEEVRDNMQVIVDQLIQDAVDSGELTEEQAELLENRGRRGGRGHGKGPRNGGQGPRGGQAPAGDNA